MGEKYVCRWSNHSPVTRGELKRVKERKTESGSLESKNVVKMEIEEDGLFLRRKKTKSLDSFESLSFGGNMLKWLRNRH